MCDKEIIDRILNGYPQDFRFLVEKYQETVFRTAMGFVHDREDAEDISQKLLSVPTVLFTISGANRNSRPGSTELRSIAVCVRSNGRKRKICYNERKIYYNGHYTFAVKIKIRKKQLFPNNRKN